MEIIGNIEDHPLYDYLVKFAPLFVEYEQVRKQASDQQAAVIRWAEDSRREKGREMGERHYQESRAFGDETQRLFREQNLSIKESEKTKLNEILSRTVYAKTTDKP